MRVDLFWLVVVALAGVAAALVAAAYRVRARSAEALLEDLGERCEARPGNGAARAVHTAYAARRGRVFAERHAGELSALVSAYEDVEAHEQLRALRDRFWSRTWEQDAWPQEEDRAPVSGSRAVPVGEEV